MVVGPVGSMQAIAAWMTKMLRRRIALCWQYAYRVRLGFRRTLNRVQRVGLLVVLVLVSASAYWSPLLQSTLDGRYVRAGVADALRGLMLGLGCALVGAAAIVTSLVLFAMQVNIERMPHGLFRRLSGDGRLLIAFALAFSLAIGVAALSTLVTQESVGYAVLASLWAILFILLLFLYAYRRALVLVNPVRQLQMLVDDTRKGLRVWSRRARRAAPLLESEAEAPSVGRRGDSTPDVGRTSFFLSSRGWDEGTKRAVQHAVSFARRYAESGDYEVSAAALDAVVRINAGYIEAKGRTFYASNPFVENPLASDGVINDTLEHLRQHTQRGIARGDEQHIEQALQAMSALVRVYLRIDYSSAERFKSHAQLAATYLGDAVAAVVPHGMPDVLSEGQRLLGLCALWVLAHGDPNDTVVLAEKIALIAATGCAKEEYRPVTMAGMAQLANLTLDLLCRSQDDIRFAVKAVREKAALVASLFLQVPDVPLKHNHSTFLGPYYSSTSVQSLRSRLASLVNAINDEDADEGSVRAIIGNIEHWADGLYSTEKDLLLAAVDARSQFTLDMIHWITGVTEILLAVSNVQECDVRQQDQLRSHAQWLIATLSWIPGDKETVTFVETYQLTEKIFEAAMDARARDCPEVENEIAGLLLSWAFKGGRYVNGWGVLARGLCACAVFAMTGKEGEIKTLKREVELKLQGEDAPEQEVLDRAARDIRERAATLYRAGHWSSGIERRLSETDHGTLEPLLEEIAAILEASAVDACSGGTGR